MCSKSGTGAPSAWDLLTKAKLAGKEISRNNIFENLMLTTRRTELSKYVRQAKKIIPSISIQSKSVPLTSKKQSLSMT